MNFRALLDALTDDLDPGKKGTTRLRQMLICLWIGSVLVPIILVGLEMLGAEDELAKLQKVVGEDLVHMTQQVWVPHEGTDDAIWRTGP